MQQSQAMEWEKVRMSWSKDATKLGHGMGECRGLKMQQSQAMEWEKVRMSWSEDATKPGHGMGEGTYVVV